MQNKAFMDSSYEYNVLEVSSDLQAAEELMDNYNKTKDPDALKEGMQNTSRATATFMDAAERVYNETGISSPIAIACWNRISFILFGQLEGQRKASENDFSDIPSTTGVVFKSLGIRATNTNDTGVMTDPLGNVSFNAPIFYTDLKAHIALRNIILSKLTSFSADLQELLFQLGQAPNKKPFRNYKIVTSHEHIINNSIKLDYVGMWNAVKLKYKRHDFMDLYVPSPVIGAANAAVTVGSLGMFNLGWGDKPNSYVIQAGQTLDDRITREVTVPVENARTVGQARNYATSYLAEGIRNMYTGSLILRGDPELKPTDILYVYDDYNSMYGPIEVRTITHLLTPESGYITVVEPQAYVEPLGVSVSTAAMICEIFNIAVDAIAIISAIYTGGLSLGLLGEGKAITTAATELTTSEKAVSIAKSMFSAGKNATDEVVGWLSSKGSLASKFYNQEFNKQLQENVASFTTAMAQQGYRPAGIFNVEYANLVSEVNTIRAASGTAPVTDLYGVSTSEISSAMKALWRGQTNWDGSAIQSDVVNQKIDAFVAKMAIASGTAAAKAGAAVAISSFKGMTTKGLQEMAGITTLNMLKVMAAAGTVAYVQMFAGMDDSNYACPIRISPLNWRQDPFVCGLDGLTRESGIWNYIKGQWRLFGGSITTISDYVAQYMDGMTQALQL